MEDGCDGIAALAAKSEKVVRFLLGSKSMNGFRGLIPTGPAAKLVKSTPLLRLNGITFTKYAIKR